MFFVLLILFLIAVPGGYIDAFSRSRRGDAAGARERRRLAGQAFAGFAILIPAFWLSGWFALLIALASLAVGFAAGRDYARAVPQTAASQGHVGI